MSRKVYCYYECPVAEQISQNPMANCEIVIQRAACREFSKNMGWDIVREVEGSGVTSPEVSQHTNEGLPQLGALPGLKDIDILLVFMFDRLIHNAEQIPTVLEYFAHKNVAVWSAMEGEMGGVDYADRLMHYISFWQDASGKQD